MKCFNCGVLFEPSNRQIMERRRNPKRLVFCSSNCYQKYNSEGLVPNPGRFKAGQTSGNKNINWKGEEAGYDAKHDWVKRTWGKPEVCEHCPARDLGSRKHQWANISGEYKRVRSDWLRLCAKCHYRFDGRDKNFEKYKSLPIRKKLSNNKSGYKNVRVTKYNRYRAYISINGKQVNLGSYKTPQEAYQAYKNKALELFGVF